MPQASYLIWPVAHSWKDQQLDSVLCSVSEKRIMKEKEDVIAFNMGCNLGQQNLCSCLILAEHSSHWNDIHCYYSLWNKLPLIARYCGRCFVRDTNLEQRAIRASYFQAIAAIIIIAVMGNQLLKLWRGLTELNINTLSLTIHLPILQTDLHTFP